MFELPPFEACPFCRAEESFGLLNVHQYTFEKRCKSCRKSLSYGLPEVDKKVIYLDQFALSNLMKAANNSFRPNTNVQEVAFWKSLYNKVNNIVLKQLAVFPNSLLHLNESLLSPFHSQLEKMYEQLSGDTSFEDHETICRNQICEFAGAWIQGKAPPEISFDIDKILDGRRNQWLPLFSITANMNLDAMVDSTRRERDNIHNGLSEAFKVWREQGAKPFKEYVEIESRAFGMSYIEGIQNLMIKMAQAIAGTRELRYQDYLTSANTTMSMVMGVLRHYKVPEEEIPKKAIEFFQWEELKQVPVCRIQSYLFAAMARKAASGQTTPPSRGMMSDINMVSAYMPFCDAMFIDNECAAWLAEKPLSDDLNYKAKIFCQNTKEQFVTYLEELEATATTEMVENAKVLYGVK